MECGKIIMTGLCCHVRSKAAFVDKCVRYSEKQRTEPIAVMEHGDADNFFTIPTQPNVVMTESAGYAEWDETESERIFDLRLGRKLERGYAELPSEVRFHLRPALEMNGREIRVESMGFLVLALVKNERCRTALETYLSKDQHVSRTAFLQSGYQDSPLLSWFTLGEQAAARGAIGLMARVRNGETKEYHPLIEILGKGYRQLKNIVRRQEVISGEFLSETIESGKDIVAALAHVMVMLVFAESMEIPVQEDYLFYVMLQMFQIYEQEMLLKPQEETATEKDKRRYRKLAKEKPMLGYYYGWHYLEEAGSLKEEAGEEILMEAQAAGTDQPVFHVTSIEAMFYHFHLSLRMLSEIRLERNEVELLLAWFGELSWKEYEQVLLSATLCKYIGMIHRELSGKMGQFSEKREDEGEENACQALRQELEKARTCESIARKQKERLQILLEDAERSNEKLKARLVREEKEHEQEKEELVGLRNYVFRLNETGEETDTVQQKGEEEDSTEKRLKEIRAERALIIGGHGNWQKKMQKELPNSQFLAADSRHFDVSVIKNKKYLIFNTDLLQHTSYYRIMGEKRRGQRVLYVHGNNVEKCMRELLMQL